MEKSWVKYIEKEENHGVFIAEPLERGFGHTLGNSLKKMLYSSLSGAAVLSLKIEGHDGAEEISGVKESLTDLLLNIKGLVLRCHSDKTKEITISAKGAGEIYAKDIQHDNEVEIVNPTHYIATVEKGGKLEIVLSVKNGIGYLPGNGKSSAGKITLDASYSPVVKAEYAVEPTRVGKSIDYDKVVLDVWTSGALSTENAVKNSAEIIRSQMDCFLNPGEKFEKTGELVVAKQSQSSDHSVFTAGPLDAGYATTLGNSLRRVLLSSIEGAAVTSVKIDGTDHEFSTLKGVKEDMIDIIMNLKKLVVVCFSDQPKEIKISAKGEGEIKAKDIEHDDEVKIINKDLYIASLNKDGKLNMTITVERGSGYVVSDIVDNKNVPIGTIPVDAVFSPITKVNHRVEPLNGNNANLVIDIWSNGAVDIEGAVKKSAAVLKDKMELFLKLNEKPGGLEDGAENNGEGSANGLELTIEDLELSARSSNCLKKANVQTVAELVEMPLEELMKIKNFGKKSADEIDEKLAQYGLALKGDAGAEEFAEEDEE